jgi:macrolide-specific efflux system membrane fusion protein
MNTTAASTVHNPRRRKSRGGLIFALVVIVAAGGWYGVHKYLNKDKDEGGYLFAEVTTGDIEDLVTATGTLQPRDYVDVGAQVSGQIEKIYVEVGDVVQKGDPLADIDATQAVAKVDGLKASLLSAETNLKTQITNRDKAKRDYVRQQNLLKEDATTKETVLNAQTTYENAERQIIVSEAQIEQQKANLRIEDRNLGYTRIIAPIAGTVMKISVKQGQTVNATQNVPNVMQIANLATMTVQADVSEADVGKLYKGIPVYFTTLNSNRRWYGTLKRIEPTPKNQNGVILYPALFDVTNENEILKPSSTAQVYFVNAEARQVLMVPLAAIQQGQQIQRELAAKEREKNPAAKPAGAPSAPGAAPAAAGAAGAASATAANTAAAATRDGAAAPAVTATAGSAPAGAAGQGNRQANGAAGQGNRQANGAAGGAPGGMRAGGGFNGGQGMSPEQIEQFRRNRAAGGQGGQPGGGFNGGGMTPEQIEQFRRSRGAGGQAGGGFNGPRPGGFGGMGAPGGGAMAASGAPRPAQRRNGTVMVKKADGTLEARRVVYGVTNRVHGEVLEGLKEGEEVVVGKKEKAPAAGAATQNPLQNQNQGNRGNNFPGGGFPGGGRPF